MSIEKHFSAAPVFGVAVGSVCPHTTTRGRAGKAGSWCDACGLKIYEVDTRECQHCAHFKDLGPPQDNHCICTKHLMGVTREMRVTYEIAKGTCFSPKMSTPDNSFVVAVTLGGIPEGECTWGEFIMANRDAFTDDEFTEMRRQLLAGGMVTGGGGAAPVYEVQAVVARK